jgi:hypothetical protein
MAGTRRRLDLSADELTEKEAREFSLAPVQKRSWHAKTKPKPKKGWFIAGPYPWDQYRLAASLSGPALVLWQLIHHQTRMRKAEEITLPRWMLNDIGIGHETKRRALSALERVGLIRVRQPGKGRSVLLSLVGLPVEDETADDDRDSDLA